MKIKLSKLREIVRGELVSFVRSEVVRRGLVEAPSVDDGNEDKLSKEKSGGKGEEKGLSPHTGQGDDPKEPKKKPAPRAKEKEPEPEVSADDETGPEAEDAAEDEARSDISDELTGKTVQSITMDPKSKLMPGAQEIVITFKEIPDPLRILLTKSGRTAFYYKGMHNTL